MRPDDITPEELEAACGGPEDRPPYGHALLEGERRDKRMHAALVAQSRLRDERVRRAERERIADRIAREARTDEEFDLAETFMLASRDGRRPDSHAWTQSLLRLAARVREGGDTDAQ